MFKFKFFYLQSSARGAINQLFIMLFSRRTMSRGFDDVLRVGEDRSARHIFNVARSGAG